MRLLATDFDNVLGLNGSISYPLGKPLLIYGENIAGKSNIINVLRYCLIPKARQSKKYGEEKRLKKDEIILEPNTSGKVEIYFEQKSKFYKLYYSFLRKEKRVGQLQKIFESSTVELPLKDEERKLVLKNLDWKDLNASSSKSLKEKLVQVGIYPEVLDILISASNIRNFSEAVNGSVIKVPEMIAAKISKLHDNAEKYLNNLKKLYGVIVLENEEFKKRIGDLTTEFNNISGNLSEIKVKQILVTGSIAKNLESLRNDLSKHLETMPTVTGEMEKILVILSSEKYELWADAMNKVATTLTKKEELKVLLEKEIQFIKLKEALTQWQATFEQLPPDSNLESISTFKLPEYKKFDFSFFANPDRTKSIFSLTQKAKTSIQEANRLCEKYKVQPKVTQINNMIKSYNDLFKVLKNPTEPIGDPALISKRNKKIMISIPLDVALVKTDYLKGIESTPLVHRPERLDEVGFQEKIRNAQKQIKPRITELREAKKKLSTAKKALKTAKELRNHLERELQLLERNQKKNKGVLDSLIEAWKENYHYLTEVFKLAYEKIDVTSSDAIDSASEIMSKKYARAQIFFEDDLTQHLRNYPEILEKTSEQKPMDIVKNVTKELKKRIEAMTARQKEFKTVNDWIIQNNDNIRALENRNKTREIMTLALMVAFEFLSRVYEKANIKRIVEELADKIEVNVKDVYTKIFPEDESFCFEHLEEGQFLSTINHRPITHPSGSQRVAISMAIMLSLGETFGLPILLDEAFDRIDVNRLRFFSEYITSIAGQKRTPQICMAGFTTYNIEKNPDVLDFVKNWRVYRVKRTKPLEKNIELLEEFSD